MAHDRFESWIEGYERAWRTPGTSALENLFTPDATYRAAPFEEPLRGHEEIGRFWEAERNGPDEAFTLRHDIVAAEGDTAVARVNVTYQDERGVSYRDLWVIVLDAQGTCIHFEEWPFFAGRPRVA